MGNMLFHMSPLYSIQYVLSWFFGLNIQEYENLFVVGKQRPDLYGSNFLTASSSPKKCAYNIHKFIKSVEHEVHLENAKPRMVIIEKLRKDHPDHIFKTLEKL